MTTTPLPPLPATGRTVFHEPTPHRFSAIPVYTADQMQAYATAARADLESENKRLRAFAQQVLKGCLTGRVKSQPILVEDLDATELKLISLADAARAVLKETK